MWFLIKQGLRGFKHNRITLFLNILMLSGFLYFFAFSIIIGYNVLALTRDLQSQFTLKIYVDPTLNESETEKLISTIKSIEGIQSVTYISPEVGLKQLSDFLNSDLKSILTENPLPASLKCKIHEYYLSSKDIRNLIDRIKTIHGVISIEFPFERLKIFEGYGLPIGLLSILLMILFFIISVGLVHVTIRVAINAREKEILLTRLLGGTHLYIRFPLLVEGIAVGLISSAIVIFFLHLTRLVSNSLGFILFHNWNFLYLGVVLTAVLIGMIGSQIAVKKYLYMDEELL